MPTLVWVKCVICGEGWLAGLCPEPANLYTRNPLTGKFGLMHVDCFRATQAQMQANKDRGKADD